LLTEGIFDLISTGLESKGIALLGSAPNYVKFYWLSKNISKAVVWMDADPAGYKANDYIKEMCDFFHIPCEIVLAKKDPKRYNRRIKSDRLFLEYVESLLV
jgi:DNA primase